MKTYLIQDKTILLLTFFISLSFNSFCQKNEFKKIDKIDLLSDLDSLKNTLINTHQNLYTYCSKTEFNIAFVEAQNQVKDSLNSFEFAKIVSVFLNTLKDSHTYLNHTSLKHNYNHQKGRTIELNFRSINDTVYVFKDKLNKIESGSRLISINGIPSSILYSEMNNYSTKEGNSINSNTLFTCALLSKSLGYSFDIKEFNDIEIELNDSIQTISYPSTIISSRNKKWKNKNPFTLSITDTLPGGVAKLTISSFSAEKNKKYYRFLKRSFRKIKKKNIEHLVIDIRNNTGGRINRTDLLMSFIKKDANHIPQNLITKQSKLTQQKFRKRSTKLNIFILKHFYKNNETANNFLQQLQLPLGEADTLYFHKKITNQKSKYFFEGKQTYLLINGFSASASVLFASAYRNEIENGIIIGSPCMGPLTGTWGNPTNYRLPNSKLDIYISTIRTNINNSFETDSNEIVPDILIYTTLDDLINKEDPLKKVIENLIE